eukprot:NODE_5768_length_678_cov_2.029038_g5745_i0.p2 GENE.NODE_5768_length_678_cov_2.029038_g5745_i0~~NODE_5768_length_678_cov_2.029038_g5745_i0.p2  ORF type:complete len:114 (+),score=4.94 NODE_5768_length_678_cov_2.029038_g5745_i0:217-558(+)
MAAMFELLPPRRVAPHVLYEIASWRYLYMHQPAVCPVFQSLILAYSKFAPLYASCVFSVMFFFVFWGVVLPPASVAARNIKRKQTKVNARRTRRAQVSGCLGASLTDCTDGAG